MTKEAANSAARRVIQFLEECHHTDISSGVGALLEIGSDEKIAEFRQGIAEAIMGKIA